MSSLRLMPARPPSDEPAWAAPDGGPDPYNQLPHIRPLLNRLGATVQRLTRALRRPGPPVTTPSQPRELNSYLLRRGF